MNKLIALGGLSLKIGPVSISISWSDNVRLTYTCALCGRVKAKDKACACRESK